jgi:hypothetical protein
MPQSYDMGTDGFISAVDFFRPKKSDGFSRV